MRKKKIVFNRENGENPLLIGVSEDLAGIFSGCFSVLFGGFLELFFRFLGCFLFGFLAFLGLFSTKASVQLVGGFVLLFFFLYFTCF